MASIPRNMLNKNFAGGRSGGFSGSVATTGNSRGLRLEKAFFLAAPEFGETGRAIRADVIGPGTVLVRIDVSAPEGEAPDAVIGAWLSFIDRDIAANPSRLAQFAARELTALEKLVETVVVDDEEELPDDVTF